MALQRISITLGRRVSTHLLQAKYVRLKKLAVEDSKQRLMYRLLQDPEARKPVSPEVRKKSANLALAFMHQIYRPETTMRDVVPRLRDEATVASFQEFYIDGVNSRLHNEPGKVVIAEGMHARGGESHICQHCQTEFAGNVSSRVVAAKDSRDLTLILNRQEDGDFLPQVEVARGPRGEIYQFTYTAMDEHTLLNHHLTAEADVITAKVFAVEPFYTDSMQAEDLRFRPAPTEPLHIR